LPHEDRPHVDPNIRQRRHQGADEIVLMSRTAVWGEETVSGLKGKLALFRTISDLTQGAIRPARRSRAVIADSAVMSAHYCVRLDFGEEMANE